MNQETRKQFSVFLGEYPLYRKFKAPINTVSDTYSLQGFTFPFYCKIENSIQTFELKITPAEIYENYGKQPSGRLRKENFFTNEGFFEDTQHFKGVCSSCKEYYMDLLITVFTEEKLKVNGPDPNYFYLRKLGQYPPYEIKPPKEILDYLKPEDQEFYKKALMNISAGYGIGAFAYFRRIIQNEILHFIQKIAKIKYEYASEIKKALLKYRTHHQMSILIEELNIHLPSSFNSLGYNPIKVLYEESSVALHELTEEECLNKAIHIDTILRFTIKKIKEESTEIASVKAALKSLSKEKKFQLKN